MSDFKDWYRAKYGAYPGYPHEQIHIAVSRLMDAVAEYVDEVVGEKKPCTTETHRWIDFGGRNQQMCAKCGVGRSKP